MSQTTSGWRQRCRSRIVLSLMVGLLAVAIAMPAMADVTPPDLNVCSGVTCDNLQSSVCSAAGFKITLLNVDPANFSNNGSATYHYQICDAHLADCPVDQFRGLSHFDLTFPKLGELNGCLSSTTSIAGSCTAVDNTPTNGHTATVGAFGQGDSSCFAKTCGGVQGPGATTCNNNNDCTGNPAGGTCITGGSNFVAKCDETKLEPGDCINMDITIAGELTGLGTGAAIVVDKEANTCTSSCMSGPSCDKCDTTPPGGAECLTRTIGFWGTHPWITNTYDPVTVCTKPLDCAGADDGKSDPSCLAGSCTSIMEGLGSIGGELPKNAAYVSFIKQLTAAKLNLNATAALKEGATCSDWKYNEKTIQEWITLCELGDGINVPSMCQASQSVVSGSGCIEALNAFNNSQDTGFAQTPAPFDRPSVDDAGNVSGADPTQFNLAQGNSNPPGKWVIGKNVGGNDCR